MITTEEYITSLNMTPDEANAFLSRKDMGCACIGCPPGVECRPGMCRCSLVHIAAKRVFLREKAKEVRSDRQ